MNRKEVRTQIIKKDQDTKVRFQILSDVEAANLNGGEGPLGCPCDWTNFMLA